MWQEKLKSMKRTSFCSLALLVLFSFGWRRDKILRFAQDDTKREMCLGELRLTEIHLSSGILESSFKAEAVTHFQ